MHHWQMAPKQNEEIRSDDVHFQNAPLLPGRYDEDYELCLRDEQTNAQTLWQSTQRSTIPKGIQQRQYGIIF